MNTTFEIDLFISAVISKALGRSPSKDGMCDGRVTLFGERKLPGNIPPLLASSTGALNSRNRLSKESAD